jgi:competence protein ComEC
MAAGFAIVASLAYLLISGSSISTVRSWIMITIMFAAVMLDRPGISLRNLALAALVILSLTPESIFDAGFQMSFAAVFALVSVYETIRARARERGPTPRVQVPLSAFFFSLAGSSSRRSSPASRPSAPFIFTRASSTRFSLISSLSLSAIVVMPAALAALVFMPLGLEAWPLWVLGYGVQAMVWCAYTVANLPGAVGRVPPNLRTVVWHDRAGWALAVSLAQAVAIPGTSDHRLWCRLRAGA